MRSLRLLLAIALIISVLLVSVSVHQLARAQWDTAPALKLIWQSKFPGDAILITPGDIAVDAWDNVYVSTQGNNTVKKFDSNGNFVKQWGDSGKGNGSFSLTLGVGVDSQNNVFVTDFYNKRIQKFDENGTYLAQWPNEASTSPAFMAIDSQNNVFVDEFPPHGDHYIEKFDAQGKLISEWGSAKDRFSGRIEDIALDKDGNLYVADPILHRIQKLDWNGEVAATFGGEMSKEGKGSFDDPFGISVDMDGNIYVLDSNFLQKLDAKGKFVAQWSTESGDLDKASNVTVDKKGNIYVFAKTNVTGADGNAAQVFLLKKFAQSSGN